MNFGYGHLGVTFAHPSVSIKPIRAVAFFNLIGRYSLRTGVHNVTRGEDMMRSEEITLAEAL